MPASLPLTGGEIKHVRNQLTPAAVDKVGLMVGHAQDEADVLRRLPATLAGPHAASANAPSRMSRTAETTDDGKQENHMKTLCVMLCCNGACQGLDMCPGITD